jgi:hypothetical protein
MRLQAGLREKNDRRVFAIPPQTIFLFDWKKASVSREILKANAGYGLR